MLNSVRGGSEVVRIKTLFQSTRLSCQLISPNSKQIRAEILHRDERSILVEGITQSDENGPIPCMLRRPCDYVVVARGARMIYERSPCAFWKTRLATGYLQWNVTQELLSTIKRTRHVGIGYKVDFGRGNVCNKQVACRLDIGSVLQHQHRTLTCKRSEQSYDSGKRNSPLVNDVLRNPRLTSW